MLTRTSALRYLLDETVAPTTSTIRGISSEVVIGIPDGMPQDCAVNFDHIQTVPKMKVGRLITRLSRSRLDLVAAALSFALGLDEDVSGKSWGA